MNSSDNAGRVQKALLDLSRLILRQDTIPDDLIPRLKRHLRPADSESVSDFHYNALKHRLRDSILTQSLNTNRKDDGPILVAKMDKELERLRRGGFRQLTAFLAVLEPLSFRQSRVSSLLISNSTNNNMVSDEDEKWQETGRVKREEKSSGPARPRVEKNAASALLVWVSPDVELRLIKDLLFVFQVGLCLHSQYFCSQRH